MSAGPQIVIIGGALSGAALTIHLVAQKRPMSLTIVERSARIARGPAFGTRDPAHRLNVPAGRMSVHPAQPLEFVEWMAEHVAPVPPTQLVQRMHYGDYVDEQLRRAMQGAEVMVLQGDAIAADAHGVTLADGRVIAAHAVVLATGNQPPITPSAISPALRASQRVLADPWREGVLDVVGLHERMLLIGTGLTAVDALLTLAERGHQGHVTVMSRRGLLPRAHLRPDDSRNRALQLSLAQLPTDVRALSRFLRHEMARVAKDGVGWQAVIDAVRPHVTTLWQRLSPHDRSLFVRRLRPYWDVLRHRAAPEALEAIAGMRAAGRVDVRAARLVRVQAQGDALDVEMASSAGTSRDTFERIVLCTGPDADVRRWRDPLWPQLLRDGYVSSDPLGLGIVTDELGRAVDAHGSSSTWLYTMGSLRRARLWETIAVPELVPQATALATELLGD